MKHNFIALMCLCPTVSLAQVYGDPAGCKWLAGEDPATDSIYLYDGATVQRMESTCPVTGSMQIGSGGVLLTVMCTGEGETWEDYYVVSTTADETVLNIQYGDTSGLSTEIKVCEIQ